MKLRIKKTGEVIDAYSIDAQSYETIKIHYFTKNGVLNHFSFDSLEALNNAIEDYKPAEPLIKDEKIRKAVRSWAEANKVVKAFVGINEHMNWTIHGNDVDRNRFRIEFFDRVVPENCETIDYTIADLCGEEEE